MNRRDTIIGMMAVPVVAQIPTRPTEKWLVALDGTPQPAPGVVFNPFAGVYPGKPTRLPVADRPLVLGTFAGFTVTGYRS